MLRSLIIGIFAASCGLLATHAFGYAQDSSKVKVNEDTDIGKFDLKGVLQRENFYRNGVQIRLTKAEVATVKGELVVRVHWAIDYRGKRWPLIILTPSLDNATDRQTAVTLFAAGKGDSAYGWSRSSPSPEADPSTPFPPVRKEWFTRIEKAVGPAEGFVDVPLKTFKEHLRRTHPDQFDGKKAPPIYVRMRHDPLERGQQFEFDAWTGDRLTAAVQVIVSEW
jgi:hypothetical protein